MAHSDYMMWLLRLQMPNPSEVYSNLLDVNLSHYSGALYYSSYHPCTPWHFSTRLLLPPLFFFFFLNLLFTRTYLA